MPAQPLPTSRPRGLRISIHGPLARVPSIGAWLGWRVRVALLQREAVGTGEARARKRGRLSERIFWELRLVIAASVLAGCLWYLDSVNHGPYARAFNLHCQGLADRAGLVGRPESDVVSVLGRPTSVYRYRQDTDRAGDPTVGGDVVLTYNYAPCPFLPFGQFQVHCINGVVEATEQLDD